MRVFKILLPAFFLSVTTLIAQEEEPDRMFTIDTPVSLDFEKEEEPINSPKKKKPKKKVFYGIKTKKGFSRKGVGERTVYETFFYLKKPEVPQTLVRDIYYYDYARREVIRTSKFDPKKGVLVHGPYKRFRTMLCWKMESFIKAQSTVDG